MVRELLIGRSHDVFMVYVTLLLLLLVVIPWAELRRRMRTLPQTAYDFTGCDFEDYDPDVPWDGQVACCPQCWLDWREAYYHLHPASGTFLPLELDVADAPCRLHVEVMELRRVAALGYGARVGGPDDIAEQPTLRMALPVLPAISPILPTVEPFLALWRLEVGPEPGMEN